jgi:hypothetical protein
MDKDLTLFYTGGSGGFLALNLILLSDYYYCSIDSTKWKIDPQHWKQSEIWPNNNKTFESTVNKPKLYFYCNYIVGPSSKNKLKIYTDIKTQVCLAEFKKAAWFTESAKLHWAQFYNDRRAAHWPDCNNYQDFNLLDAYIQQELLLDPALPLIPCNNSNELILLLDKYQRNMFSSDSESIRLQDIVRSHGKMLTDKLELTYTLAHKDLVDYWLSQHPDNIIKMLTEHNT